MSRQPHSSPMVEPEYLEQSLEYDEDRPSKSQVKRELHAILAIAKDVVDLPFDKVKQLPLDEKLLDEIQLAQKIKSHEGKRRQVHYVGKLMRGADVQAIEKQLSTWKHGSKEEAVHLHGLEQLRDRLLEDDQVLTELIEQFPAIDVQAMRASIRAARKEQKQNEARLPGQDLQRKNYRALFQTLKDLVEETK